MTPLGEVVDRIRRAPGCVVHPSTRRQPQLTKADHLLPADLLDFYALCSGVDFFTTADYTISILPPAKVVPANPLLIGEQVDDDITASWYVIAASPQREHLSIDLAPARLGRCYDSFWDSHGFPGSCPIVARTFTELLENLLAAGGNDWYWLHPDFPTLGDAYD